MLLLPLIFVPRRVALWGCRVLAAILMRRGSSYRRQMEALIPRPILAGLARGNPGAALRLSETRMLHQRLLVLGGALFPRWRRRVSVRGIEHVRAGLDAGRGVILWVHPCLGSSVSVKQALFEAGLPLAHLTRPAHGFSRFPFGMRVANPFLRRAENRFLAERVVIDAARTVGPLRRLQALLRENRVVSITVTNTASRLAKFPFLGGIIVLPGGPVELAASTGAVLLPVFTVGSARVPVVEIGAPLPVTGADDEAVRLCHLASLEWLQERVDRHPLDWIGWRAYLFQPAAAGHEQP
ncbi:MAG: hypothetical protein HY875_15135 [Chloroflexi bacterium]|nr:hypothetical protein [Chloroflexota bacterium]